MQGSLPSVSTRSLPSLQSYKTWAAKSWGLSTLKQDSVRPSLRVNICGNEASWESPLPNHPSCSDGEKEKERELTKEERRGKSVECAEYSMLEKELTPEEIFRTVIINSYGEDAGNEALKAGNINRRSSITAFQVRKVFEFAKQHRLACFADNMEEAEELLKYIIYKKPFDQELTLCKRLGNHCADDLFDCVKIALEADPDMRQDLCQEDIENKVFDRIKYQVARIEKTKALILPNTAACLRENQLQLDEDKGCQRLNGQSVYGFEYRNLPRFRSCADAQKREETEKRLVAEKSRQTNKTTKSDIETVRRVRPSRFLQKEEADGYNHKVVPEYQRILNRCVHLQMNAHQLLQRYPTTKLEKRQINWDLMEFREKCSELLQEIIIFSCRLSELDTTGWRQEEKVSLAHIQEVSESLQADIRRIHTKIAKRNSKSIKAELKRHPLHHTAVARALVKIYSAAELCISTTIAEKSSDEDMVAQLKALKRDYANIKKSPLSYVPISTLKQDDRQPFLITDFLDRKVNSVIQGINKIVGGDCAERFREHYKQVINRTRWETVEYQFYAQFGDYLGEYKTKTIPAAEHPSLAVFYASHGLGGVGSESTTLASHAANAALTQVYNGDRLLFSGVRHGNAHVRGLNTKYIKEDSIRCKSIIEELMLELKSMNMRAWFAQNEKLADAIEKVINIAGQSNFDAKKLTAEEIKIIKDAADLRRAKEIVMLGLDSLKCVQSAIKNRVEASVNVISINLQTGLKRKYLVPLTSGMGNETVMIDRQTAALEMLEGALLSTRWQLPKSQIFQNIFGDQAETEKPEDLGHSVRIENVMTANVPVNTKDWAYPGSEARATLERACEKLIGSLDIDDPVGGTVEAYLTKHPSLNLVKRDIILELVSQLRTSMSNKSIYGGNDVYQVARTLALIGYYTDHLVIFNCKSGKDRTGQMDAEVKLFAMWIDATGMVPPIGTLPEEIKYVFGVIYANSGNAKIQEYATGIGGNKSDKSYVMARYAKTFHNFFVGGASMMKPGESGYVAKIRKELKRPTGN